VVNADFTTLIPNEPEIFDRRNVVMSRFFVNLALVLAVTMLSACSSTSSIDLPDLNGTSWVAVQIGDLTPPENIHSTLYFDQGKIAGKAACNSFFGVYEMKDQSLTMSGVGSTMMFCAEGMEQETAFLGALQVTTTYRMDGDQLRLLDADGNTLVTLARLQHAALEGPLWQLTMLNDGQDAVTSLPEGVVISAQFGDGRVSGSGGCNQYFGDYTVNGGELTVSGIGATKMFCGEPEGVMDQEALFLQALEKAARFEIREQSLTVFGAEGGVLLQFSAVK